SRRILGNRVNGSIARISQGEPMRRHVRAAEIEPLSDHRHIAAERRVILAENLMCDGAVAAVGKIAIALGGTASRRCRFGITRAWHLFGGSNASHTLMAALGAAVLIAGMAYSDQPLRTGEAAFGDWKAD